MGRIAEALRRAQQERARQRDERAVARAGNAPPAPPDTHGRSGQFGPQSQCGDVLGQASILDAPPLAELLANHVPAIPQEAVDPRAVVLHEPRGAIAEKYRSLRTRLLTANTEGSAQCLAITSCLPGEGKTTTVLNLGFSLAELRHLRVAMIDLGFGRAGLTAALRSDEGPGMAEVLRGEKRLDQVCVQVVRENLYLVPAGDPADASPSELLTGKSVRRVVRELNERFHYSLIDVPSVNDAADAGLIGPLCHAALLVVRMNRTPESVLRHCVKTLQANRVAIAGCVLAGCEGTAAGLTADGGPASIGRG